MYVISVPTFGLELILFFFQHIVEILMDRREMLAEYFALTISDSGLVESLPLLLRDYIPNLDNLPSFLMRLGPQVCI